MAAKLQAAERGRSARAEAAAGQAAAAKLQAAERGRSTRAEDPRVHQAVASGDVAAVRKLIAAGVAPSPAALREALTSPVPAVAAELLRCESAWGVEPDELACWKAVQAALHPAASEDAPEPEPADVSDASWQAETLLKLFGEEDGDGGTSPPKDPALPYTLRRVAAVGCYVGGRSAVPSPPFEPAFDTEVTAREGFGVSLLPTGDVYVGGTAGGVRDGIGALWASQGGGTYIGGWRGGVKHGEAWWALPDGSLYEGTVRYGQRHGRGVYTYANGDIFVGQWFTGKKHGAGKYKCKEDGTRYTGTWSEGELTRASVTTADGTTFFSAFVNGRPAGPGAFLTASGALASGHHPVAAVAEEGEEAEPLALQWSTTSITASELTSSSRLASKFGGGGGPPQPRRKALIVAPDYAEGGAFPPLKLQAAARQLRELLSSRLGLDPGDITLLSAAEAADAVEAVDAAPAVYAEDGSEESPAVEAVEAKPAVVPATKEAVVTAVETMSNSLGRGDVAFLAFLCHGQRLLETDAAAEACALLCPRYLSARPPPPIPTNRRGRRPPMACAWPTRRSVRTRWRSSSAVSPRARRTCFYSQTLASMHPSCERLPRTLQRSPRLPPSPRRRRHKTKGARIPKRQRQRRQRRQRPRRRQRRWRRPERMRRRSSRAPRDTRPTLSNA